MSETLICSSCGKTFTFGVQKGMHHPKDCPEGLDQFCPGCDQEIYEVPTECKNCRPKQDMQRS
jgi:hypothetical protein